MTGKPVTDDKYVVLGRMTSKFMDLSRRVRDGSLPSDKVLTGLQSLIEGNFDSATPAKVKVEFVHGLFVPTDRQIENIRRWNTRYGWGFTEEQIKAAEASAPKWPENKLVAVVLVPYLDTVGETAGALWSIAAKRQKASWRYERFASDAYLRLLSGIKHPGKCLRWEVIDLSANWDKQNGTAPKDVRNEKSPHAGILAAAAHHPRWVRAMDGKNVPYVWAAGYECGGEPGWRCVPWLSFGQLSREGRLCGDDDDSRSCDRAVPARFGE